MLKLQTTNKSNKSASRNQDVNIQIVQSIT